MSTNTNPEMAWGILSIFFDVVKIMTVPASIIACWCCIYHACLKPCGVGPWGAGDAMSSPDFDRSVNPISSRGSRICPQKNTGTPGCSDLPTAQRNRDGNELNRFFIVIEDVKKIQKQNRYLLQKLEVESKKHYEEIQNQTKQLKHIKDLVLDLKISQSSKQKAEKVETELIGNRGDTYYSITAGSRQGSLAKYLIGNCVICLDKPLTHAVRPCGHLIACTDCAKKISKKCPICRRTIFAPLRIFLP